VAVFCEPQVGQARCEGGGGEGEACEVERMGLTPDWIVVGGAARSLGVGRDDAADLSSNTL
jgi:hypothetical protein